MSSEEIFVNLTKTCSFKDKEQLEVKVIQIENCDNEKDSNDKDSL